MQYTPVLNELVKFNEFTMKSEDDILKLLLLSTTAVIVVGGYMIWKQKYKKLKPIQVPIPKKWRKVGEVQNLNLFPLKSGKHLCLDSAECTDVGIKEHSIPGKLALVDRAFVVYNEETKEKCTIKDFSLLLFVEVKAIDENTVVFTSPGIEELVVKLPTSKNEINDNKFITMCSNEKIRTADCGDKAADWFSKILKSQGNIRCRLGYYARNVLPARSLSNGSWERHMKLYTKMNDDYMGSYSDIASYMIMTQCSLDDLNSRLAKPVNEYYFRPNIMIKGTTIPFEEDEWDWLKIGDDIVLRSFKLCTRCVITNINPETGLKSPDQEPLKTLRKLRPVTDPKQAKVEKWSPIMGVYLGLHRAGVIKIGDPVYVNCDE